MKISSFAGAGKDNASTPVPEQISTRSITPAARTNTAPTITASATQSLGGTVATVFGKHVVVTGSQAAPAGGGTTAKGRSSRDSGIGFKEVSHWS
jgi:hypothetical protein